MSVARRLIIPLGLFAFLLFAGAGTARASTSMVDDGRPALVAPTGQPVVGPPGTGGQDDVDGDPDDIIDGNRVFGVSGGASTPAARPEAADGIEALLQRLIDFLRDVRSLLR